MPSLTVTQTLAAIALFSGAVSLVSWLGVILTVNPKLDPVFNHDRQFDWFLRRAHPFFFAVRAQLYAGAVISKWLAHRTMAIAPDFSFRDRVPLAGRIFCWGMFVAQAICILSTIIFLVLGG